MRAAARPIIITTLSVNLRLLVGLIIATLSVNLRLLELRNLRCLEFIRGYFHQKNIF
jgi:hypothetical protein